MTHTDCGLLVTEPRHLDLVDHRRPAAADLLVVDDLEPALGPRHGRPRPRARCRHAVGPDLHERHLGRTEGGHLLTAATPRHGQPDADDHGPHPRRRRLRLHAAVPLERGPGRVGALDRGRLLDRARPQVLGFGLAAGCAPVRIDVLQLHRQTAGVPARTTGAGPTTRRTRCGSRSATRARHRWSTRSPVDSACDVIDAYGATEGGVAVNRDGEQRPGALGQVGPAVKVVDDDGNEKPRGRVRRRRSAGERRRQRGRDREHRWRRPVRGLLQQPEARPGRPPASAGTGPGDLGYVDADGYLYFAGRNADWIRVDGENFPAGPIEEALRAHPDVVLAAVYGVPDDQAGDQIMAGLVLREGAEFDPEGSRRGSTAGPTSGRSGAPATSG